MRAIHRVIAILLVVMTSGATVIQECHSDEPAGNSIVPKDSKLELVHQRTATLNSGLTEGPAIASFTIDKSVYRIRLNSIGFHLAQNSNRN